MGIHEKIVSGGENRVVMVVIECFVREEILQSLWRLIPQLRLFKNPFIKKKS